MADAAAASAANKPRGLQATASALQLAGWLRALPQNDWVARRMENKGVNKCKGGHIYLQELIDATCADLGMRRTVGSTAASAQLNLTRCFLVTNKSVVSQIPAPFRM